MKHMKILFQGDSITDCGRKRDTVESLGNGYVHFISAITGSMHPDWNLSIINKGIGGNTTSDLKKRWTEDCIQIAPDIVSILIGINDTWKRYTRGIVTSKEEFEENYCELIERTISETEAEIVLIEPFLLPVVEEQKMLWRDDLDPKIDIVRTLVRKYHTRLIPIDGIFAKNCSCQPSKYWAQDGVHPSKYGHGLLATEWLKEFDII